MLEEKRLDVASCRFENCAWMTRTNILENGRRMH